MSADGLGVYGRIASSLDAAKVLCVHSLLEHTDVTIMYDNEALYDICRRTGLVYLAHDGRGFFKKRNIDGIPGAPSQ